MASDPHCHHQHNDNVKIKPTQSELGNLIEQALGAERHGREPYFTFV